MEITIINCILNYNIPLYHEKILTQQEIGLYIIEILKEKPLSPKNIREMFYHEHHVKVRNAISILCDTGKLRLDSNMLLYINKTK